MAMRRRSRSTMPSTTLLSRLSSSRRRPCGVDERDVRLDGVGLRWRSKSRASTLPFARLEGREGMLAPVHALGVSEWPSSAAGDEASRGRSRQDAGGFLMTDACTTRHNLALVICSNCHAKPDRDVRSARPRSSAHLTLLPPQPTANALPPVSRTAADSRTARGHPGILSPGPPCDCIWLPDRPITHPFALPDDFDFGRDMDICISIMGIEIYMRRFR